MTVFQYLAFAVLLALAVNTLRAGIRGRVRRRIVVFWLLVWATTALFAAWPRGTVIVARAVGIGRGTDLVLYCCVFAMLIGFFYIYSRFRRVERELTLLVRQLAIRNPMLPAPADTAAEARNEKPRLPSDC
jgi:small membrane protein